MSSVSIPSLRAGYFLGFLVCAALLACALYAQYHWGMSPCPLCVFQRIGFIMLGGLFLLGALQAPKRWGRWVYLALLWLVALVGAALAGRHLWIQSLPPALVPSCGPGLAYLFQTFPFAHMLKIVLTGSGACAKVEKLLGVPIPAWSLAWFLLLGLWAGLTSLRSTHGRRV